MRRRWLGPLLLAPLMVGGCATDGGSTATAVPTPSGSPWVNVLNGNATPSPAPTGYTATPSTFPTGFLPVTSTSPTPPAGGSTCAPQRFNGIGGATVVPSSTSAAVTWWNPGGSDVVQYRVTAITQDSVVGEQRDVGWTVVTPGTDCGFLTATVTGLDAATDYVFSVDAVMTRLASDGTRAATVARSVVTRTS